VRPRADCLRRGGPSTLIYQEEWLDEQSLATRVQSEHFKHRALNHGELSGPPRHRVPVRIGRAGPRLRRGSTECHHLLGSRWYVNTTQDFLNSDEQALDLRTTIGGGGGSYLLRSSSQYLALGGGLAWNNERYTDPLVPTENSAEAYLGSEFMTERMEFRRPAHQADLLSQPDDQRRYRLNYNSTSTSTCRATSTSG